MKYALTLPFFKCDYLMTIFLVIYEISFLMTGFQICYLVDFSLLDFICSCFSFYNLCLIFMSIFTIYMTPYISFFKFICHLSYFKNLTFQYIFFRICVSYFASCFRIYVTFNVIFFIICVIFISFFLEFVLLYFYNLCHLYHFLEFACNIS